MSSALERPRKRNTGIKRPGFHIQQPQHSSSGAPGDGEGVLVGARDRGSSLPDPHLYQKENRFNRNLNFSLPLHAQTPSGTRGKSGVQGACVRLQRQPGPVRGTQWLESHGQAGQGRRGLDVALGGVCKEQGGKPQRKPCSCEIFL